MKRFSPYVSAGLVASMFYMLFQIYQATASMAKFGIALHHSTILTLFSVCGFLAILLSLSGFKSLDNNLKYISYFGFFGAIVLVLTVWILPFFV